MEMGRLMMKTFKTIERVIVYFCVNMWRLNWQLNDRFVGVNLENENFR